MATDATGTPTTLGIPTFDVSVDAPTGNGSNAQMSSIDALLQERPKTTVGSFSSGPPSSPSDGDVWVATLGNGVRWQFQYNASSSSSYKWEFIGGSPHGGSSSTYNNSVAGAFQIPGTWAFSLRAGDYCAIYSAFIENNTGTGIEIAIEVALDGTLVPNSQADIKTLASGDFMTTGSMAFIYSATAGQVVDVGYYVSSIAGSGAPWSGRNFALWPVRVS